MKLATFTRIAEAHGRRESLAVVTHISDGVQCVVSADLIDGELSLSTDQLTEVRNILSSGASMSLPGANNLFVRSYTPPPRMLIIGAVHIAQALAPMAATSGFEVVVIDPRGAFASTERFPGIQLSEEWPDEVLSRIGIDEATAVVTLSHDPKLDDPALELALPSKAFYIGALGSRRTHEKRLERLRAVGLGEMVGRIHSPIGLGLGGRSPAEIAVAILAEVIQVRYREG